MEHLIKRQGSHLPSYFVFGGGYGGGGIRLKNKNWSNKHRNSLHWMPKYALLHCLVVFLGQTTTVTFF
jgi:hypothetical protein